MKAVCFLVFLLLLSGCQNFNSQKQSDVSNEEKEDVSWSQNYDTKDTAVVVEIKEEEQTITIKKLESAERLTLSYKGATNVVDKYESALVMKQIPIGEIVNIYYKKDDLIARKVEISPDAWEYTMVENLSYDQSEKLIYIGNEKFRYGESFTFLSNEKEGSLIDLNPIDVVTVKGIDKKVCSVIVTKGHGYITLSNDETFLDGWIDVGQESAKPITKDMLVVASEGNHKVTIAKDGAGGTKSVTVKRNEKTVVDVGDLKSETPKSGSLKFTINPSGASLYIDGTKTDYSELVVLDYGAHRVMVRAEGYSDFSQTVIVGSSYAEIEMNALKTANNNKSNNANSTSTTPNTNPSGSLNKPTTPDPLNKNNTGSNQNTGISGTGLDSNKTDTNSTSKLSDTTTDVLTDVLKGVLTGN